MAGLPGWLRDPEETRGPSKGPGSPMSLLDLFENLSLGLLSILLFAWYFPAPNSVWAEPGVSEGEKQKFPSSFGMRMIYLGLQTRGKKPATFPTGVILFSISLGEISIHQLYYYFILLFYPKGRDALPFFHSTFGMSQMISLTCWGNFPHFPWKNRGVSGGTLRAGAGEAAAVPFCSLSIHFPSSVFAWGPLVPQPSACPLEPPIFLE